MHTDNFRFDTSHRERASGKLREWIDKQISKDVPTNIRGLYIETIIDISEQYRDSESQNEIRLYAIRKVNAAYINPNVSAQRRQELLKALENLAPRTADAPDAESASEDSVRSLLQDRREEIRRHVDAMQHHVGRTGRHPAKVVRKF